MTERMLLIARIFTGALVVNVMAMMWFGTWQVFTSDLSTLSTGAANSYIALIGIPGGGLYGLYKWARSDRARERQE